MAEGYNLYGPAGTRAALISLYQAGTVAAHAAAGTAEISIAHADDTDGWYGLAAESAAGELSELRILRVSVSGGVLAGDRPRALVWATARPAAGGAVRFACQYDRTGERGEATQVQVVRCTGPGGAGANWASPIETIDLPGNAPVDPALTDPYDDGETVYLGARAITADGVAGPATWLPPVVADASGPDAVPYVTAEQS